MVRALPPDQAGRLGTGVTLWWPGGLWPPGVSAGGAAASVGPGTLTVNVVVATEGAMRSSSLSMRNCFFAMLRVSSGGVSPRRPDGRAVHCAGGFGDAAHRAIPVPAARPADRGEPRGD